MFTSDQSMGITAGRNLNQEPLATDLHFGTENKKWKAAGQDEIDAEETEEQKRMHYASARPSK